MELILWEVNSWYKYILFLFNIINDGIKNAGIFNQIENWTGNWILNKILLKKVGTKMMEKDNKQKPIAFEIENGYLNFKINYNSIKFII